MPFLGPHKLSTSDTMCHNVLPTFGVQCVFVGRVVQTANLTEQSVSCPSHLVSRQACSLAHCRMPFASAAESRTLAINPVAVEGR